MSEVDRRALLMAGAGVTTYAALATFEPATAGTTTGKKTQSHTFSGSFTGVSTPDWHYLPFKVEKSVTEIRVSYDYEATRHRRRVQRERHRHRALRRIRSRAREEDRVPRLVGRGPQVVQGQPALGDAGYLAGPLTPGTWSVILGRSRSCRPGWTGR